MGSTKRPEQRANHGRQDLVDPAGVVGGPEFGVASKCFIAPIARQDHGHGLPRHLGDGKQVHRGDIGKRLAHCGHQPRQVRPNIAPHRQKMMVRAIALGNGLGIGTFILGGILVADTESPDPAHGLGRHDGNQSRIDAARQHHADRHIRHEAALDRILQGVFDSFQPLVGTRAVVVIKEVGTPVHQFVGSLLRPQAPSAARQELLDAGKNRLGPADRARPKQVVHGAGIDVRRR